MAFVFTRPDSTLLLASVAMLAGAGACSGSSASGAAFGSTAGAFFTISVCGCSGLAGVSAGDLMTVTSFATAGVLAEAEALSAETSATTAAEGFEDEGAATGVPKDCSGDWATTSSGRDCVSVVAAAGAGCGGGAAVPGFAGATTCGTGWGCVDCILVQP